MHLKHLTINGFKSFAKKGELEFSSPITAIVGPNGSGKSNVAESFRFVLGEQAPSKMRGKKGEDLIWGGSDAVTRGNRAAVAVTLDNAARVFPLDFDEITLERVVHRDGTNEYLINGSPVRLRDVQEVLAAANIGPSGHHIISQGEADRILAASPKERREMIEDALGLKVYQFKKVEAEKKLDKTRENIETVEGLRREVAPHLKFLEKQMKKLERAVALRESLHVAYAEYLKREEVYLNHHQTRLDTERGPGKARLAEIDQALNRARTVLEGTKQDEQRSRLVEAEANLRDTRNARSELLRQAGTLEGQVSFLERRLKQEREKAASHSSVMVSYQAIDELATTLEREAEKAVRQDDPAFLRRALTDFVRSLRQFLAKVNGQTKENSLAEEEKELQSLALEKAKLDRELGAATRDETNATKRYDEIRAAIEADQTESRDAEREVFRLVNERTEAENSLSRLEYELAAIERDRDEFKREIQEAVVLIGRAASSYLEYQVSEPVLEPEREKQRERRRELEKLKIRLEEAGGGGEEIEKEYRGVKERDDFLVREIADLNSSVEKLEQLINELNGQLNERFSAGTTKISQEFNRFFALMFGGGAAELLQVKLPVKKRRSTSEDIEEEMEAEVNEKTEEGIEISVKLPNKRVKGLDMLSGGERALTSIALIFAMSQVNPPLFVILDETDAALDEANSRRYGDMIEALAKKSQLILITHNRETMSRAGILYGVTMSGDGISKLLSVRLDQALQSAK